YITLHVENFARIRKADIELAPLTLFVGDNNSGKSYLASLIWGVLNLEFYSGVASPNKEEFKDLNDWICESMKQGKGTYRRKIKADDHQLINKFINIFLDKNKERLVNTTLHSSADIGHIALDIPFDESLSFVMNINNGFMENGDPNGNQKIEFFIAQNDDKVSPTFSCTNRDDVLQSLVAVYLLFFLKKKTSFFPASRTAFLLAFRSIIGESLDRRFFPQQGGDKEKDYKLSSPRASFVRLISDFDKDKKKFMCQCNKNTDSIVEFIEKHVIHGQIDLTDTPIPDIVYRPEGFDEYLPMYLSSSIVTEIAPFLACLKYDNIGDRCIIEEPEISLHPGLQWKMAQVLIRIVNSICPVIVSTHSDTIIQHVNNMIKLANRDDGLELAKEYDYENEDIISSDKIRVYQFDVDLKDHLTDVKLMEHGYNGFRVPTFGVMIREIHDQIWAFQIDVDEENAKKKNNQFPSNAT
ncbi:MAG: ATP-binding protein, partial [Planctomycetaceae bacterium]|nr:ATP-binding protein [Planctomycetaceae bacterium]